MIVFVILYVFIIIDKTRVIETTYMEIGDGVMRDTKLKLMDLNVSQTLGCAGDGYTYR